jgi:hypothetical protein
MSEHNPRQAAGILRRSIPSQKAARVTLDTGPEPLADRLAAMVIKWEHEASLMIDGTGIDYLLGCAAELRAELER